ncbi:MAG: Rne/Rng family ribonuclease [Clostridia bacterium]|nr:Rne/Rng family ribonuclease [Clostridia bacterium]
MIELIVNSKEKSKQTILLENGKLIEYYDEQENETKNEGNIYVGIVKDIIPGMQSAFIDIGTEKNSFIHLKDILPQQDEKLEKKAETPKDITKVIKQNDKLLVQVKKDSNELKGARTSTHIGIPSRLILLMPNTEIVTISQKIEKQEERERLLKIVKENLPKNMGAVVRTAAEKKSEQEIKQEIEKILNKWKKIENEYKKTTAAKPKLIYKSQNIAGKIIIDISDKKLDKITVNSKKEYDELTKAILEEGKDIKVELKENQDLIEQMDLGNQIAKLENRKIWLNCGGFITIDKTEALTAIDVNTGKFTGNKNLDETIYKVNYEATIEIAKQLRARDIGGIIIIDYIDMHDKERKQKIENKLKEELKKDRAKTQVEGFTKLDLMELTRKHICSHKW